MAVPRFVSLDGRGLVLLCQKRPGLIYQAQRQPRHRRLDEKGAACALAMPRSFRAAIPINRCFAIKREGRGFFNLPAADFGMQDAAPSCRFFGVPAATLVTPSHGTRPPWWVQPVMPKPCPKARAGAFTSCPPWRTFPHRHVRRLTRLRLSQVIERGNSRSNPPSYLWVLKAKMARQASCIDPKASRAEASGTSRPIMAA